MYHKFNLSHGSLLGLLWCKLKWQIPLEHKATIIPRPPNPQKKLQPGSQWVLKPSAGPCCEITASAHQCETRNSATKCLMSNGEEEQGKTEHRTAAGNPCSQFHLPPSTHRPFSRWALAELTAEPSNYILNRNITSFHTGNDLLLMCEYRAKSYFLGKSWLNRAFIIVSKHKYNIQGSHKSLLLITHTGIKRSIFQDTGFSPNYHYAKPKMFFSHCVLYYFDFILKTKVVQLIKSWIKSMCIDDSNIFFISRECL